MPRPITYLRLLLERAAQKSVLLSDQMTVLFVPVATLILWMAGAKMTNTIQATLGLGVAMTVIAVVFLRLLAASYLVWKDDQAKIQTAGDALQRELSRADREERASARVHTIGLRTELGDILAKMVSTAEASVIKTEYPKFRETILKDALELTMRSRQIINALSYDLPLRICAYNLSVLASRITYNSVNGKPTDADWNRIQRLKKVAFRVIHKIEDNYEAEILAMLEAQNIMEDDDDEADAYDGIDEHKSGIDVIDQLRNMIKNPELLALLRADLKAGRTDSL